jgi:hypothetical protein
MASGSPQLSITVILAGTGGQIEQTTSTDSQPVSEKGVRKDEEISNSDHVGGFVFSRLYE